MGQRAIACPTKWCRRPAACYCAHTSAQPQHDQYSTNIYAIQLDQTHIAHTHQTTRTCTQHSRHRPAATRRAPRPRHPSTLPSSAVVFPSYKHRVLSTVGRAVMSLTSTSHWLRCDDTSRHDTTTWTHRHTCNNHQTTTNKQHRSTYCSRNSSTTSAASVANNMVVGTALPWAAARCACARAWHNTVNTHTTSDAATYCCNVFFQWHEWCFSPLGSTPHVHAYIRSMLFCRPVFRVYIWLKMLHFQFVFFFYRCLMLLLLLQSIQKQKIIHHKNIKNIIHTTQNKKQ